jgi:hypothetical protein
MVWKAETRLLKMMARHCLRSVLLKPPAWMTRICFSTVDLPLSPAPAPLSMPGTSNDHVERAYRAAAASPHAPASSYHCECPSRSPRSDETRGPLASFQNTLSPVPYTTRERRPKVCARGRRRRDQAVATLPTCKVGVCGGTSCLDAGYLLDTVGRRTAEPRRRQCHSQ